MEHVARVFMAHLSLASSVKTLAHLSEEQSYVEEILLDAVGLTLTRGALSEIVGQASTGKTSIALALLARLTADGEICAAVDACDGFDPVTAHLAGVELDNMLWVRCSGRLEEAFLAADMLVQAKGFGAIWLNLSGLADSALRMVPRTYWYRYRTRIKETPTVFLVTATSPLVGSATQRSVELTREKTEWSGSGSFKLLREFCLKMQERKGNYGATMRTRLEVDYTEV